MNHDLQSTKDLLVQVTVRIIREAATVRDVTVRKIIDTAGVNLNAVNYHFGSKQNLIREAVREVIGGYYRSKGIAPGSSGPDLYRNLERICRFLFDEPVAARLALDSELELSGAGMNLTYETMSSLSDLVRRNDPSLADEDIRFRIWAVVAVIHQFILRPEGCVEWLGSDPRHAPDREALLDRLCVLAGLPGKTTI